MSNFKQSFRKNWTKVFQTPMIPRLLGGKPDKSLNHYHVNGVSLLIFVNFYAALDTLMAEIHGDLLLTHRDLYIVEFRYIRRYKITIVYDHVVFGNLVKEYQIEMDEYAMENFVIMQRELVQIVLAAKQFDDSPFSTILY